MKRARILILTLLVVMVFSAIASSASAKQKPDDYDIVKAKQQLVEEVKVKSKKNKIQKKSTDEINRLLAKMVSEGVDSSTIAAEVEKYGVYQLNTPEEQEIGIMSVGTNDITMSKPNIYLDSNTNQWIVIGGGWWKTDNWLEHVPNPYCGSGSGVTCDVGGYDGFGVGYTNTSGTYNTLLNSVYAYMSDGEGRVIETETRSDGNGSLGFGFKLQDYIYKKCTCPVWYPADTSEFSYVGKHFAGLARYNSNFVNYDGIATTYYSHTWESTSLSSVSFGVSGKTAGIDFTYTNGGYDFPAFSADTGF